MQYRSFGRSGPQVSVLGFGAMRIPTHPDRTADLENAVPLLRRGLELGINYIDTAHGYCEGTSEVAVGQAVKGLDRSRITITTKVPAGDEENAGAASWRERLGLSLKRLDTHIDYVLFHGLRWEVFEKYVSRPGMALEVARKAQAEGLVKHIGFSSHDTAENIVRLIDTGEFEAVLMQYNLLDRHNEPAVSHAHERGLGVSIMGPVAGGRLVIPGGVRVAGDAQMKTPELALRFVWNNPGVSVALSGMSSVEQLEENVASANRLETLSDGERGQIQQLFEQNLKLADLYCTGCGYCLPCPNDVQIPENFRYMNWYRIWGMQAEAKKAYDNLGSEKGTWGPWAGMILGKKAEDCLQCGECEPKCPQRIPIVEQLQEVARVLGGRP